MTNFLKISIKKYLSGNVIGVLDYFHSICKKSLLGLPFNGQQGRAKIFDSFVDQLSIDLLIETGTFRGATTSYFTKIYDIPVVSIEVNPRFYSFSQLRFMFTRNVKIEKKDSREFLRQLGENHSKEQSILFYLDAHWGDDLPLWNELDLIASYWKKSVIVIDDFQVFGDSGYRFDDYGPQKSLTLENLENNCSSSALWHRFFPVLSSENETGSKSGCIVLTNCDSTAAVLRENALLRSFR